MRISQIEGCTRTLGEAQGYYALPLRDIVINDTVTGPQTPAMETAWHPTPEEITALVLGAPIILRVVGTAHPPVMIDVAQPTGGEVHLDDLSAQRFARDMMRKLARKRLQGFGGWEDHAQCSAAHLSNLLRIAVEKGDPLDVGNFAMMLQQRGENIEPSGHEDLIAEMLGVLKTFVTETRAYSSPECDECEIVGPILRNADAAIAKAEAFGHV